MNRSNTPVDQVLFERLKLDRLFHVLSKRTDAEGKLVIRKILEKQKKSPGTFSQVPGLTEPRVKNHGLVQQSSDKTRPLDITAGIRQPQATAALTGQNSQRTSKSGATASGAGPIPSKATTLKAKRHQSGKADPSPVAKSTSTPGVAPKIKNNHISAKPTNFFMSIQSASKKPGTSNAALLSAKMKEGKDGYVLASLLVDIVWSFNYE